MSTTMSFQYIKLDYLDTMTNGDPETMQQMLGLLVEEIPSEISKLLHATATADWEEAFQISHKLKTTLAFVGNEDMVSLNKTIEHCTRHKEDLKEMPAMVEQLCVLSKLVVDELDSI